MAKKKDGAAVAGDSEAVEVPTEIRKAALLAELAEIDVAEKQAAKIEFPKALYKDGNVHEVVIVESADEEVARADEGYGALAQVKG